MVKTFTAEERRTQRYAEARDRAMKKLKIKMHDLRYSSASSAPPR
jgi:hypothetical protein